MEIKKEEIQNCINRINNEIEIVKKEKSDKINQINNSHEQNTIETKKNMMKKRKNTN